MDFMSDSTIFDFTLDTLHLLKPSYDFYFLQAIEFERLLGQQSDACTSDRDQSEVLTEPLNR